MSQHRFIATTTAGIAVDVMVGYDRILDNFFVEVSDQRELADDEQAPDDYVQYDSIYTKEGRDMGLYAMTEKAKTFGVTLPDGMPLWLEGERERNERTNYNWFWPLEEPQKSVVQRYFDKHAITAAMSNDEGSSDQEMVEHLTTQCTTISAGLIERIIGAERSKCLRDWQHEVDWRQYLPDGA